MAIFIQKKQEFLKILKNSCFLICFSPLWADKLLMLSFCYQRYIKIFFFMTLTIILPKRKYISLCKIIL